MVSGYKVDAHGLDGIGTPQDPVDISDPRGPGNAVGPRAILSGIDEEYVTMYLQAASALPGDLLELLCDPVRRRVDALAGRQIRFHARKCVAGAKPYLHLDRLSYAVGLDGLDGPDYGRFRLGCRNAGGVKCKIRLRQAELHRQH